MKLCLASPPALDDVHAELARRDLSRYSREAWPVIEPKTAYSHNWHIEAITEYLTAVTQGQILRLLINMPPRYMKSIAVSVMWPTWCWLTRPSSRWIFVSYSQSLSTKHSIDRRTLIQSDWYRQHWGHLYSLADDQNAKTEYQNDRRGVMVATSVGGTATGKGGDVIVVDDLHNPTEAQSDIQRETAITFFDQTLSTRLDNKKTGAIVVVMQRLHEKDLSGHLLERGNYVYLKLPAEAEKRTIIHLPISGRNIVREEGDFLWPEREGSTELAAQKRAMGSYAYAGQYQQRPSPAEGGILKRHWWRYWCYPGQNLPAVTTKDESGTIINIDVVELPQDLTEVQSWDMAFKDTKESAYVVGQVWGRTGADCFLLDQVRDKMDFPSTISAVEKMTEKWPKAGAKWVEDKANGPAVIATLGRKISGLIPINPEGGKEARAHAISPMIEAGNVFLPHPAIAVWVHDFLEECAAFPNSVNNDQVDSMTQALLRLARTSPLPDTVKTLFKGVSLYG